jgi:uncharacterized protein with GYD domain
MSLWTPGGEHELPDPDELSDEERARLEEAAEEVADIRRQLAEVPASRVVANHAMGLYELAAIHLSNQPPNLAEARVAIDAMGGIVDALDDRMGDDEGVLRDALAQLRLAFVQLQAANGEVQGPTVDS